MTTSPLHVVLGASGGAGNAIARALLDSGLTVRAVNRSGKADLPDGIGMVAADITGPAGIARALDGATVVYMAAQPAYHRWPQEFPTMLDSVIAGCEQTGAKLVMVDNLYSYGPGHGTLTESTEHRATDKKGRTRSRMLAAVLGAHESRRIRATVGQASDYFGPRADNSGITALAIAPAAGSGSLRWLGALDVPHSAAYLPDIARAYVELGTSEKADGRVWILPHGHPVTGGEFLATVGGLLDTPRKSAVISKNMLRAAAPFHRISRESLGVYYQWNEPWIADDGAFQATFGPFVTTPLDVAIKAGLDWYSNAPRH